MKKLYILKIDSYVWILQQLLQQLTEMTDSAPPKRAQGSSPSAFLPTLAGINQSSLLGSPFGSHNVQQQQSQQQQQLMQSAMLGNRSQSDRVYQMGKNASDWTYV